MRRSLSQKILIFSLGAVLIIVLSGFGIYKRYFSGITPAIFAPPKDITKYFPEDSIPPEAVNETNFPLKSPPGFAIFILAKDLPGARVLKFDDSGNLWLSRTSLGAVTKIEIKDEGVVGVSDFFKNLRKPHGLAFAHEDRNVIYIAEENSVSKFSVSKAKKIEKLFDLPHGDGHYTRTLGFGPDKKLYISVGSSCNVCNESEEKRASIIQYDPETKISKIFAKGLRNAVFFIWNNVWPKAEEEMWTTEMGRDWLGDDLPADEINIIKEGGNYGWPICYGKNLHDTDFDKNTYIRNPCQEPFEIPSFIDIPAHSAPLGLAFIPKGDWPEDYWYDLLVSYHGSWNRSKPTGYKIVRHKFDVDGNYQGAEDFIAGWLVPEGALGRPVDIVFGPDGGAYISDDKAGVIYKVIYQNEGRSILKKSYDKSNLIRVETPELNGIIKSPLIIEGEARGNWFFEASFPIKIIDAGGKEIAVGHAEALRDWMTSDFVPFRAVLEFKEPDLPIGTIILEKDNPSGLPENYDEFRIPVRFR